MATARLRVFPQPDEDQNEGLPGPAISIRLSDLYPLLAQAYRDNYVWLRDFEDDERVVRPAARGAASFAQSPGRGGPRELDRWQESGHERREQGHAAGNQG